MDDHGVDKQSRDNVGVVAVEAVVIDEYGDGANDSDEDSYYADHKQKVMTRPRRQ